MASADVLAIERAADGLYDELVAFTQALVRVPSVTGQEEAVQLVVARALRELGLDVDVWEPDPAEIRPYHGLVAEEVDFHGRPNVVGTLRGTAGGRSLILCGHVDTVTPGDPARWAHPPYAAQVVDGNLYGRGAVDMKAGLAAALFALRALADAGVKPRGDVLVQSVIGEENGGVGTLACLLRGYRADAAIIMEPTRLAVVPAQGGSAVFRLHLAGRTAHACVRDEGVSAVEKFCYLLAGLREYERQRNATLRHPLYESFANKIPVEIGVVRGGDWASSVPDWLVAEGRAGLLPGEEIEWLHHDFERHVAEWANRDPWLREHPPRVEWWSGQYAPSEVPVDLPLVKLVQESFRRVVGREPAVTGVTYGSDMRHYISIGRIPTVMFGPGDVRLAHYTDEYVPLAEVLAAVKVLALAISEWGAP